MMFIPLLLIVLLFFYLDPRQERRSGRDYGYGNGRPEESARDILDRRFAEGDLTEDEYMKKKDRLRPRK